MQKIVQIFCVGIVGVSGFALRANAAIRCEGTFQVTKAGDRINTPYCADGQVAAVAREYGMRVSSDAVRNNPSVKEQACRLVGADLRARDACAGYRNDERRR